VEILADNFRLCGQELPSHCTAQHSRRKIDVVWNYGTYTTWGGPFDMDVKMYTFDSTKIAAGITPIKSGFERRAPKESGFNLLTNGLSFTLLTPSLSTLQLYGAQGRLVADLTASVRRMTVGSNSVQYKSLGFRTAHISRGCLTESGIIRRTAL